MDRPFSVAFVPGVTPGKWARVWAERMPQHPLSLVALDQADALAELEKAAVDLAFVRLPVDSALAAIPLYEEQPVVAIPRDHELTVLDSVGHSDLDGVTVLEGGWRETIELVAAGVGVTVMPQSVARAFSRRDVAVRPAEGWPTTRVALVWFADRADERTEEFIGVVRGRTVNSSRGKRAAPSAPVRLPRERPTRSARRPRRR